jgi:cytidyltransferase-like protein
MTRVYVDMVADLFHYGHADFLRQARQLGDTLIVGIHSDATVAAYKREPFLTMEERVRVVESCRYVDEVIPDAPIVVTADWIERIGIDLVLHGDDFTEEELARCYGVPIRLGIFRTVPYTTGISTSDIARRVHKRLCPEAHGDEST